MPKDSERLKAVVRRLPPNLPEEIFWNSVAAWVTPESVNWKSFHAGKMKKKIDKENVPSRAYVAFKTIEQVQRFSREYDGHMFRDKQGNESFAVVEYAPFQKIPPEKRKIDARAGTILQDEDYLSFIESLKEAASSIIPEVIPVAPQPTTTPLLDALKAQKAAAKDAAAILSYHAHYDRRQNPAAGSSKGKDKASSRGPATKDEAAVFSRKGGPAPAKGASSTSGAAPLASGAASNAATASPSKGSRRHKRTDSKPIPVADKPAPSTSNSAVGGTAQPPNQAQASKERPPRRPRMFEAALAGAGVASTTRPAPGSPRADGSSPVPLVSGQPQRRERRKDDPGPVESRGRGGGGGGGGPKKPKVPFIISRETADTLGGPAPAQPQAPAPVQVQAQGPGRGGKSGGGRSRNRNRGGAPGGSAPSEAGK